LLLLAATVDPRHSEHSRPAICVQASASCCVLDRSEQSLCCLGPTIRVGGNTWDGATVLLKEQGSLVCRVLDCERDTVWQW
jgi:hypothetical protein